MSVRVDFRNIERRFNRLETRGQFILASQVLADANNYVPELSGDLKRYSIISNDNKSLKWTQPYARFQYYGQFNNYTKPGTGPKWDKKAARNHSESWIRILMRDAF